MGSRPRNIFALCCLALGDACIYVSRLRSAWHACCLVHFWLCSLLGQLLLGWFRCLRGCHAFPRSHKKDHFVSPGLVRLVACPGIGAPVFYSTLRRWRVGSRPLFYRSSMCLQREVFPPYSRKISAPSLANGHSVPARSIACESAITGKPFVLPYVEHMRQHQSAPSLWAFPPDLSPKLGGEALQLQRATELAQRQLLFQRLVSVVGFGGCGNR